MDSHHRVSAISKVKHTTRFSPDEVSYNYNTLTIRYLQDYLG